MNTKIHHRPFKTNIKLLSNNHIIIRHSSFVIRHLGKNGADTDDYSTTLPKT